MCSKGVNRTNANRQIREINISRFHVNIYLFLVCYFRVVLIWQKGVFFQPLCDSFQLLVSQFTVKIDETKKREGYTKSTSESRRINDERHTHTRTRKKPPKTHDIFVCLLCVTDGFRLIFFLRRRPIGRTNNNGFMHIFQ